MHYVLAFGAGLFSTLIFHQGLLALFYAAGAAREAPYSRKPTAPLGIPEILSFAFWGGVWGVVLWALLSRVGDGWPYWAWAALAGAVGPTLVTFLVVFPLKGRPEVGGGLPVLLAGALVLNAAWGLGVALIMLLLGQWGWAS